MVITANKERQRNSKNTYINVLEQWHVQKHRKERLYRMNGYRSHRYCSEGFGLSSTEEHRTILLPLQKGRGLTDADRGLYRQEAICAG